MQGSQNEATNGFESTRSDIKTVVNSFVRGQWK
jgi:hypothetical protein